MENDRVVKQNYLRSEILNKGYNTDNFVLFLEGKKSGEFDIDNFDFEELKNVILILIFSL